MIALLSFADLTLFAVLAAFALGVVIGFVVAVSWWSE